MKLMSSLVLTLSLVLVSSASFAKGSGSLEIKIIPADASTSPTPSPSPAPAPVVPAPPQDQYLTYNFGMTRIGFDMPASFSLSNNGNVPLTISQIDISGFSYWTQSNCPSVLNPGERCYAQVDFRPVTRGFFQGRLTFETNGGNVYIDLSGWAQ